jgi:parvulin-like peptidyl-prolyl isomerase
MTKKISIFFAVLLLSTSIIFAKTIVTVNGHKIDDSIIPKGYEQLTDDQKAKLTEQLIKEELIHQYLLKSNIVRDKEFKKIFKQQKEMAQREYKKVSGKNLTKAQIRNIKGSIALMLYQQKQLMKTKVSNQEAKNFYDMNQDKFNYPNSVEIANIIVKDKQEAKNIIRKLRKASNLDKEFIKLAREHKQNGYMGWFGRDMMPKNLFDAAYRAKPKTVLSQPIKTKYGYHVVYVLNKKKAGNISFQEAKDKIKEMLKRKKVIEELNNKVNTLYGNAEIVY